MTDKIQELKKEIEAAELTDAAKLEAYRIQYIGAKGAIKGLYGFLKTVPNEQKKEFGQLINGLREIAEQRFNEAKENLENNASGNTEKIDLSRPGSAFEIGARHPLSVVRKEIISIFERIGYTISEGPEVEDDWHNFSA